MALNTLYPVPEFVAKKVAAGYINTTVETTGDGRRRIKGYDCVMYSEKLPSHDPDGAIAQCAAISRRIPVDCATIYDEITPKGTNRSTARLAVIVQQ